MYAMASMACSMAFASSFACPVALKFRTAGGTRVPRYDGRDGRLTMFNGFDVAARRVVIIAQDEARKLNHHYIGTEHILLGLLREGEGVAANALANLGISLEVVRQQVVEIIGQGQGPPGGHIPFTPRAKNVLELSLSEAQQLGHNYIGTEHILLGLIREGEGEATRILADIGADADRVRERVLGSLG